MVWVVVQPIGRAVVIAALALALLGASLTITPLMTHLSGTVQAVASPGQTAPGAQGKNGTKPPSSPPPPPSFSRPSPLDPLSMDNEVDRPDGTGVVKTPGRFLTSSGRVQAWLGAIRQADQRPLLGYGFGTEDHVFIDRYYVFQGARSENTWIGTYLQLGAAGVILLAVVLLGVARAARRALRLSSPRTRLRFGALAGVFAAGCVEMFVQSYALSAGDIAMLSFWMCAGALATAPEWAAT
jgi:hypothetical protein